MRGSLRASAAMALVLFLLPAAPASPEGSGSYPPPASGDWVITEDTWVANETIHLNGNLSVRDGTLTLENVTLIGNLTDGMISLVVAEGAGLRAYNSNFMVGSAYNLSVALHGNVEIRNSTFLRRNATDWSRSWMEVHSAETTIQGCIVEATISIADGLAPVLDGTVVRDAVAGIRCGAGVHLSNMSIGNCAYGVEGGPNSVVSNCSFEGNPVCQVGLFLERDSSIQNCRIDMFKSGVDCIDGSTGDAKNISVQDCQFDHCLVCIEYGHDVVVRSSRFNNYFEGMYFPFNATIDGCDFNGMNRESKGWGIVGDNGSLRIINSTFENHTTSILLVGKSSFEVQNCTFTNDSESSIAGGIGRWSARNCTFSSENPKDANIVAGLVDVNGSGFDLTDCFFRDCQKAILCMANTTGSVSGCRFMRPEGLGGDENATIGCRGNIDIRDSVIEGGNGTQMMVEEGKTRAVNVSLDSDLMDVNENASLEVGWYFDAKVQYQNGAPAQGAMMEIRDRQGGLVSNATTNLDGRIPRLDLNEYIKYHNSTTSLTPHRVSASLGPYARDLSVNINQNMDLRMVLQDISLPWVKIDSPANGAFLNRSSVLVSGQAKDAAGLDFIRVRVDDGPWVVANGTSNWTARFDLGDGEHALYVEAVDAGQNKAADSVRVTVDTVPPELLITSPEQDLLVNTTAIELSGRTESGAALFVDGEVVPVAMGAFRTEVKLSEGPNRIPIVVRDAAGNTKSEVLRITRDTIPPALTIASPRDGGLTNQRLISLNGTVEAGARVYLFGSQLSVNGTFFSSEITLEEGWNNLTVAALDPAGNRAEAYIRVILDTVPPSLVLGIPNNTRTRETSLALSGRVEPGASLSINGVPVTVEPSGNYSHRVSLLTGANTVRLEASDAAGNTATLERTVHRDAPAERPDGGGGSGGAPSQPWQWVLVAILIAVSAGLLWAAPGAGRKGERGGGEG